MFTELVAMKTKTSLIMLAVILLCFPLVHGFFIFTDSCGKGSSVNQTLYIEPLKGTWIKVLSQPSSHVQLTSKFNMPCYLKPNVIFQLRRKDSSVEVASGQDVLCSIPTSHQWLTAVQKIHTVVSCNQDERAAKHEIQLIGEADVDPSREGKDLGILTSIIPEITTNLPGNGMNLKQTTFSSSDKTSTELSGHSTLLANNHHSSTDITNKEVEVQTVPFDRSITTNDMIHSSAEHITQHTSSSDMISKTSGSVPERTSGEHATTEVSTSSTYHISSDNLVTDSSGIMVTTVASNSGLASNIIYIVIICFAVLFIFVITYGCFLLYRWRLRRKNMEINQRLVNKKHNVVNYRNAEEGEVQMKYKTMGRKKSKENIIEDTEVPKCLKK